MILEDLLSMCLRIGELAFAAVVAGLTGSYLQTVSNQDNDTKKRFIYTEVVAGLSILLSLLWLFPFSGSFIHWPVDLIIFALWMVSFGLLVQFIGPLDCGNIFYWGDITQQGVCQRWKADVAFAFLSAIFWLVSALLGLWYIHRRGRVGRSSLTKDGAVGTTHTRRRWYRNNRY